MEVRKPLQTALAVRPVGRELVAALVAQQRHRRLEVEARQRQQRAQEHTDFSHTQAQRRRGREQGRQIPRLRRGRCGRHRPRHADRRPRQ